MGAATPTPVVDLSESFDSGSGSEDEEEMEDYSDSEDDSDYEDEPIQRPSGRGAKVLDKRTEESVRRILKVLRSPKRRLEEEKEDRMYIFDEELFDFPRDREDWTEEDLQEFWAEASPRLGKPGWDPAWAEKKDWKAVVREGKKGGEPSIASHYLPFYKSYPVIPDNNYDIATPRALVEELDRIEEFLTWGSYIFRDGSSYEGTIWDDGAHGKGVYVADQGLVRYEGEWFQNTMDGHGVVEVDIPEIQPVPGSKFEAKMRAKGKIIKSDYMSPEDRKWLRMDIWDSIRKTAGYSVKPYYLNDAWVKVFGKKPETGRYKYAGQWKHGHMHGCGVYEVNERIIYGRFYFGEHLDDKTGCDADVSALHAGIAEVAAAKARMFANKPDGMVREERGPYGDPQHPYFYEEEDVWMAPGFINQFYEAPDYWKTYLEEVDQEREMWLNSFYKAPLRLPMPAELEHWWEKDVGPEFVLINKEPKPDPEDPSKLVYEEDPIIYHIPTGKIINYVDDDKYGIRLFWQPPYKEGEDIDLVNVDFLPLGFDEFYGLTKRKVKESALKSLLKMIEKWADEKKKASESKLDDINQELDLVEAEICLEEEIEDLELVLRRSQKEEEKRAAEEEKRAAEEERGVEEEEKQAAEEERGVEEEEKQAAEEERRVAEEEKRAAEEEKRAAEDLEVSTPGKDEVEFDEDEDEDEEEQEPSSFGAAFTGDGEKEFVDDKKRKDSKSSPFSSLSLSIGAFQMPTLVPTKVKDSFSAWKRTTQSFSHKLYPDYSHGCKLLMTEDSERLSSVSLVTYPHKLSGRMSMRAVLREPRTVHMKERHYRARSLLSVLAQILSNSKDTRRTEYPNSIQVQVFKTYSSLTNSDTGMPCLSLQALHLPMVFPDVCARSDCDGRR